MGHDLDSVARERLQQYIDTLGAQLKDRRKRESFAIYAAGVLGSAERKSVEPMASLASGDATTSRHLHSFHPIGCPCRPRRTAPGCCPRARRKRSLPSGGTRAAWWTRP